MTVKRTVLWLNQDRNACGIYRCYIPALSLVGTNRYDSFWLQHKECFYRDGSPNFTQLRGVDLMVIQRAFSPKLEAWVHEAQNRGIKVVFETDDDLFHIPRHNPAYSTWSGKAVAKFTKRLVKTADHCLVSTPPLRDAFMETCEMPASHFTVAYNHLHEQVWGEEALAGVEKFDNAGRVILGWQGSSTHDHDFAVAVPALRRILDDFPQTMLRFFGDVPRSIKGTIPLDRFEFAKGVPFEQYPRNLARSNFDIGLAPLAETRFNKSKSNVKVLDYAAVSVPCVASPLPAYKSTITHGSTGMLASTEDEWYDSLATLILGPRTRRQMGKDAHTMAWTHWGPEAQASTWIDLFDKLLGVAA